MAICPYLSPLDSADVWRYPDNYKLNADGTPVVVAGVPPDFFSKTGQRWGNPIYDWEKMKDSGFRWWLERLRFTLEMVDVVRIDHFRGFLASWEVPGDDETAENGTWVEVPGRELFEAIEGEFGNLPPLIAEDLGDITTEVEALRDDFGFPGMRILQFAFGGDSGNMHLPHNYIDNCVAYTGTHDNDTSAGWFNTEGPDGTTGTDEQVNKAREFCLKYLDSDGSEIHRDFVKAIWNSVAATAIAPMQDLLGLGNRARMNLPATLNGNWQWRCPPDYRSEELVERLRDLSNTYGRTRSG